MTTASLTITDLTRNETYAAIDAAPHSARIELAVTQADDRRAGRRFDITVTGLTITGSRDLINAVHQHMEAVHETGTNPA